MGVAIRFDASKQVIFLFLRMDMKQFENGLFVLFGCVIVTNYCNVILLASLTNNNIGHDEKSSLWSTVDVDYKT